jgi:probable F420-dependent oxidoreductase
MPGDREDIPIPDPLIWLAYAAAVTTRVKLATGVLILPEHNPVLLAKQVATLDHLAGGRVILGVGVGWLREEFDAIGVPFEERGARADDHIEALRVLWRDAEPTFNGPFTRFERAQCWPKPVQPGGVPIVIGGSTKPAARRAGRLGDGFFPFRISPDELAGLLDVMGAAAKDAGRDPAAIEITTSGSADLDTLKRLVDLGVTRVVYPPLGMDLATLREQLDRLTGDLIAKV